MALNPERLRSRVAGRKEAEAVVGLVNLQDQHAVEAFIDELKKRLGWQEKKKTIGEHLEQGSLVELQHSCLDFGVHAGEPFYVIPRDYLHWLLKSSEETVWKLSEYLRLTKEEDGEDND